MRAHFHQLSSARGAEMIAAAQARGLPVTADVALYQLLLTDEMLHGFSSLYHVQPPLRTAKDRDGLRQALKDGVIQELPATISPTRPMPNRHRLAATEPGISSVELLLPLALRLVEEGLLDLPTLLRRLEQRSCQSLRLPAGRPQSAPGRSGAVRYADANPCRRPVASNGPQLSVYWPATAGQSALYAG